VEEEEEEEEEEAGAECLASFAANEEEAEVFAFAVRAVAPRCYGARGACGCPPPPKSL
jgi:hypothetical protein